MTEKEIMALKLQEISSKLTSIISDKEIKVVINNDERTISFLTYCFAIPSTKEKEKYIATWEGIFSAFENEKKKIEKLKQLEIMKKQKQLERIKKQKQLEKIQEEKLSYTQNLNYINSIIERNSELKEKPKEKIIPKVKGFKYGVKISKQDDMQNYDWFVIEESDFEFVILPAPSNGKHERKFKNYIKKCKEHNLCFGIFFEGISLSLQDAKKEVSFILNKIEEIHIDGPIIYEINNKAVNSYAKDINVLSDIISGVSYIGEVLSKNGYNLILNVDLNTISILIDNEVFELKSMPIVYNVLPSQTKLIDDTCQIIEFNPKNDYEKIKLSKAMFKRQN